MEFVIRARCDDCNKKLILKEKKTNQIILECPDCGKKYKFYKGNQRKQ